MRRLHREERAHSITPPEKIPVAASCVPSSAQWGFDYQTTATKTDTRIRVEDVISRVRKAGNAPDSNVSIRVLQYWIYASIPKGDDPWTPSFSHTPYNPITGVPGMAEEIRGTIRSKARVHHFPSRPVREAFLNWDGVTGTSAPLCIITTTAPLEISVVINCVAILAQPAPPLEPISIQDLIDRSPENEDYYEV